MGLPTPGAAVFVVAVINSAPVAQHSYLAVVVGTVVMLSIGYLMVSTIEFASIKQFKFTGIKPRAGVLLLGLLIALTWNRPGIGLLVIAAAYVVSGPFLRILKKRSKPLLREALKGSES
jgi:phosphatidylserine synthase